MSTSTPSVDQHFAGKAAGVRAVYDRLTRAVSRFGAWSEDPKKTSIHLNRKTAFAGVATRKDALVLTVKANRKLEGKRVVKIEKTSAHRWHVEVRLGKPAEIDAELISWLREAYELSS